ncbi:MAG: hypothetical protein ND866_09295 [Pyrinomonadaceae bacterium]|nr:hypothetical protein [Pyrinomonadaceae bacterium]
MNETKVPENKAYKVTLILLVGLAAFSTAMRDLNRLKEMVSGVQEFTSQWRGTDSVAPVSTFESCPNDIRKLINSSVESGSGDVIALAGGNEVEEIDCETIAEPEVGARVELVGSKKSNRSVAHRARYAPARNLKEEISLTRRRGNWPARFEYKTFDRTVTVDLPMMMVNDIKGDLQTNGSPDFPLSLLGRISRKQSHSKTETGRREFMIKRFERISSSRRAS